MQLERPVLAGVIGAIEQVKGRKWTEVRDQYEDPVRDMALYLGQRLCGLKLAALAAEVGLRNYGVVSTNIKRYERRLASDPSEQARMKRVLRLLNCEM